MHRSRLLPRLLNRPPIRLARFYAPDKRGEVGISILAAELHGHLNGERQLNIGASQFIADEIVPPRKLSVQKAEMPLHFTFDTWLQRRSAFTKPARVQLEHERQHRRAFGIVQKL